MKFSEYCDKIENTNEEQQLLEFMRTDDSMQEAWDVLEKYQHIPVFGKVITALGELSECENIAAFRESRHYPHLMNWDLRFDAQKGSFSLSPGPDHLRIVKTVFAVIGAGLLVLFVCRKLCWKSRKS